MDKQPGTAGRYQDMGSAREDLIWVRNACQGIAESGDLVRAAAVARYLACFQHRPDRFRIPAEWVAKLPLPLQTLHADMLAGVATSTERAEARRISFF